jgi:hypothetical protein
LAVCAAARAQHSDSVRRIAGPKRAISAVREVGAGVEDVV